MSFIKFIFALSVAAVLAAQDTSATLSGVVRGPEDTAVGFVNVELALKQPPHSLFSVMTDEKGRFQFSVLPSGTYTLTISQRGFYTLRLTPIQVANAEQKTLPSLQLDVAPSGCGGGPSVDHLELLAGPGNVGNLSGRVIRDEHHLIAGVTVTLHCEEALVCGRTKTDSSGNFVFFDLKPEQQYTMNFSHPGFYPSHQQIYEVRPGYDATYSSVILEHCPHGNCTSKLRPGHPLVVCE